MTLGEKLRTLRRLEGHLRGLGREMSQGEDVRAVEAELGKTISQSYLSLIESGLRPHLSESSRQLLAAFFKIHPGFLVTDPPGYHTELASEVATLEDALDRWLLEGAERLGHDRELGDALKRLAAHSDSRRCLMLLGEMIAMPGFIDRLSEAVLAKERT